MIIEPAAPPGKEIDAESLKDAIYRNDIGGANRGKNQAADEHAGIGHGAVVADEATG